MLLESSVDINTVDGESWSAMCAAHCGLLELRGVLVRFDPLRGNVLHSNALTSHDESAFGLVLAAEAI